MRGGVSITVRVTTDGSCSQAVSLSLHFGSHRIARTDMRRMATRTDTWLLTLALVLTGCVSSEVSTLRFGIRRIQGADRTAMFGSAQRALVDLGFRLDRVDLEVGLITTRPSHVKPGTLLLRDRSRLSSPGRLRRIAEVRVVVVSEGIDVLCNVAIQRLETEAHRMFRHEAAASDVPNETAIDRGAASTNEQNTVWQTVHRDKPAERRILDAIARSPVPSEP